MRDPQKMVIFSVSGGLPLYQSSQRSFKQKKENFAILAIRKPNQQQRMLDKTLLFLSFATGKQLPFNSPLNNSVGDIFGVLELLQYTTSPSLEGNIQIGFVIPIPMRTCAI